jgi:lipopolysaccharide export system permease protein
MHLWWRHLFFDALRLFASTLVIIFTLYVVIDYGIHSQLFSHAAMPLRATVHYYAAQFSCLAHSLVPLAFLLATLKSLLGLNLRRELVALKAGGISNAAIFSPIAVIGTLLSLLLLFNYQYLFPSAFLITERCGCEIIHGGHLARGSLRALALADGSKLFYQRYDPAYRFLFDVLWLQPNGDLYRAKYLEPHRDLPVGWYVDFLTRMKDGLELAESWESHPFEEMRFEGYGDLQTLLTPPEALPLSVLMQRLPPPRFPQTDTDAEVIAFLNAKLALPWVGLVAVLVAAPFCLRFSRRTPLFLIYGVAIFGFLTLQTALDVSLILAKSHVINPVLGMWTPLALAVMGSGVQLRKMR